ncbi:PHP domain-containing protein [Planococcus antarcticus]|uniref:Phosphatase n=1 Tax=Planococcus antarcticus DSM 14505 TaxID=1185653 RepID=A0ABM6D992_9BACL|nr:PHP domain-containing protein [Planococcus antarcticus]ANU12143.1 phosphatase [Planococcus antarcticus DSM 14505]
MKADLHVHSHYSDGADSVENVIKKAKKAGVTAISFVDHDTVSGWPEQRRIAEVYGIQAIPGIEISAYDFKRQRKVHILGYHFTPEASAITNLCNGLLELRQSLSLWQVERIREAGFHVDTEAVIESAKPSATVYKQHIMKQLIDAPYTSKEYKFLYKSLFKGTGVAAGDIEYAAATDAVRAIVSDGGLAVVAHPGQLDSFDLIPELLEAGLGGIERNHFDHSSEDHRKVEELAQRYGLVMTGGSDYHGAFGTAIAPGDIISPEDVYIVKKL